MAQNALGYANGYHAGVTRLERAMLKAPSAEHLEKLAAYFSVQVTEILPEGVTLADLAQLPVAPALAKPLTAPEPIGVKNPCGKDFVSRLKSVRKSMELETWELSALVRNHGAMVTQSDIERWEAKESTPNPIQMTALERATGQGAGWLEHGKAEVPKAALSGWGAFALPSRVA